MWSRLLVEWESIEIGVDWIWGGVGGEMEFGLGWVIFFLKFDLDDCWRQHEAKNCYICSITNVKHPPLQYRTDTGISTVKYTITVGDKKSCYK